MQWVSKNIETNFETKAPNLIVQVRNTGYRGFFLRVLKEGMISADERLIFMEANPHQVSVSLVDDVKFHDKIYKNIPAFRSAPYADFSL